MYVPTQALQKKQTIDDQSDDGMLVLDPPVSWADSSLDAQANGDRVQAQTEDLKQSVDP
jgi:hypothetical protein